MSKTLAVCLEQNAAEILRQWESRVRSAVPAARRESRLTLRNSIPKFLDELVQALESSSEVGLPGPDAPREHAEQRSDLPEYSLEQVVLEYSLLRGTIIEVLSESAPVEMGDLRVILGMIDLGIAEASAHYAQLQASALRASEERFRLLVANVKDYAIFMLDPTGHIVTWNRGAERIKGYTEQEIIGKHFSIFYTPEDVRNGKPQRGLTTAAREDRFLDVGLRVRKDGSTFCADVVITALRDDTDRLRGFAKVTRDVTDRQALEEELHKQTEALVQSNHRKDEFLAMLAHELRNPLASIVTSAEILRLRENDDPILGQAREVIERQGKHLARLVDDLLDVARITQDKITLQKKPIELKQLVDQVAETLRPFIEERQQTLSITLPEHRLWLEADFVRLSQVLANLVHNSAKFTAPGGRIDVLVWEEDEQAVIQVTDNGSGINPGLLPHVFDLFAQGSHSHNGLSGGLGIGLTLCQRLVEMHDGSITARSDGPGKGSVFTVRLPAMRQELIPDALKPALLVQDQATGSDLKRVLVVDDNVDAAASLAVLLGFFGHSVRIVHNGEDALQAVAEEHPHLVLLDIGMPDMDGYEVARRLRAMPDLQDVQLVALTGYGQEQDRRKSREAGFDGHLTKPTELAALLNVLAGGAGN